MIIEASRARAAVDGTLGVLLDRYPDLDPCRAELAAAAHILIQAFARGGKLLVAGNGGSAADAEHIVGELMKGCTLRRPLAAPVAAQLEAVGAGHLVGRLQGALPAIALSSHTALLSAILNDQDGSVVYAQQVMGYGRPGDALMALSTSGRSTNVMAALQVGRALGLHTLGLTGSAGGPMAAWCDVVIRVPYEETPAVQERHLPIYHALCIAVERAVFVE